MPGKVSTATVLGMIAARVRHLEVEARELSEMVERLAGIAASKAATATNEPQGAARERG